MGRTTGEAFIRAMSLDDWGGPQVYVAAPQFPTALGTIGNWNCWCPGCGTGASIKLSPVDLMPPKGRTCNSGSEGGGGWGSGSGGGGLESGVWNSRGWGPGSWVLGERDLWALHFSSSFQDLSSPGRPSLTCTPLVVLCLIWAQAGLGPKFPGVGGACI